MDHLLVELLYNYFKYEDCEETCNNVSRLMVKKKKKDPKHNTVITNYVKKKINLKEIVQQ